jgi:hypothetical protein
MSHLHLEKIRIAWPGESSRLLACLLACARIGRAHVRRKGPSLLLVRHCCRESAVVRLLWAGPRAARGGEEEEGGRVVQRRKAQDAIRDEQVQGKIAEEKRK